MEKLYSEIANMPILVEDAKRPVGRVRDLVIDPENGNLVAFAVNSARTKIIVPRDVEKLGHYLLIRDRDDICASDEILRVKEVLNSNVRILKSRVFTARGEYLGRVYDYAVDITFGKLKKIFAAKSLFGVLRFFERIISAKYILEIKPGKIIVKDSLVKVPIEERGEEIQIEEELSSV